MEPRDRTSDVPAASPDSPDAKPPERVVYFRFRERPWTYVAVIAAGLAPAGGLVYLSIGTLSGGRPADWPVGASLVAGLLIALVLERRLRKSSPPPRPGAVWELASGVLLTLALVCLQTEALLLLVLGHHIYTWSAYVPFASIISSLSHWLVVVAGLPVLSVALLYVRKPIRARLRIARAECPACGYSLQGLPGPSCPECGRLFGVDH